MKHTLFPLVLCLFLVSCANAGTATPTQPAPTSAPAYEPSVPALLTGLPSNKPAETPPEFASGTGGEVAGIPEDELKALEAWEIYQKVYQDEAGAKTWPLDGSFETDMLKFISGKADLQIKVNQDAETGKVLVAVIKQTGDQQSAYWDFDNEVVANTNPMSLNPEWESGLVACPKGTTAEFRYNSQDGYWYMFAVDKDGNAVAWFATNRATVDNQEKHWVEVETLVTDWAEYGHKLGQEAMAKAGINVESYLNKVPAEVAEADKQEAAYRLAWQDYLAQGIEKDPLNSDKTRKYGYSDSEPCDYGSSPAVLLGYSEGEVESDYLRSKDIDREVRAIWAIPDTQEEAQSLVGVYLTDGTYVPFMALEVGSDAQDFSQDRKLDGPEDLDSLIGKTRVIKVWHKLLTYDYIDWKDYRI